MILYARIPFECIFLACGRLIDMNFISLVKLFGAKKTEFQKLMESNKPGLEGLPQKFDAVKMAQKFNAEEVQKGEMPSANFHGSAKGMAKLASLMANEGINYPGKQPDGTKEGNLISQDTWKKMHDGEKLSVDSDMLGMSTLLSNNNTNTSLIYVFYGITNTTHIYI